MKNNDLGFYELTIEEAYKKYESNFKYEGHQKVYIAYVCIEDCRQRSSVSFIAPKEIMLIKKEGQYGETCYKLQNRFGKETNYHKEHKYIFATDWSVINNAYYDQVAKWEKLQIELEEATIARRAESFAKMLDENKDKLHGVTE